MLASIDKGTRGSAGRKCPHTASKPLRIPKYSLRPFPCLRAFQLRQNCFASDSLGFSRDFCSFGRRRAFARQGQKGKKHRKDWLSDAWVSCPSMAYFLRRTRRRRKWLKLYLRLRAQTLRGFLTSSAPLTGELSAQPTEGFRRDVIWPAHTFLHPTTWAGARGASRSRALRNRLGSPYPRFSR